MAVVVGIDVAKQFHWVAIVVADSGTVVASRRVENDPGDIEGLITQLRQADDEYGQVTAGIDLLGGAAGLLTAMLLDAGIRLVHVPGLVVNRARRATKGGEAKSDPRDAATIADQLRLHDHWRVLTVADDLGVDLRLLVGRRRELVVEQTRRLNRLRDLLTGYFPGLERTLDVTNLGDLILLTQHATPGRIRRAGRRRMTERLLRNGVKRTYADSLVDKALIAASTQHTVVTGEDRLAEFVAEFATEAITTRRRIAELDGEIAAGLDRHPDAALIRSLPGMGATLTAEFLAEAGDLIRFSSPDALAAAAGLAPVLQQSGKTRYLRRPTAGNKTLKFVFYQSAFCALQCDPASRAFYARKRAEGKRHHQALIALARRRVNVLHALLRTRQPYRASQSAPAA